MKTLILLSVTILALIFPLTIFASPLTIPTTSLRKVFGGDITDEWKRVKTSGDGESLCPETIKYSTFMGGPDIFKVPHNTISFNGNNVCSGTKNVDVVYYNSSLLGTDKIPDGLNKILTSVGFHVRSVDRLQSVNDSFLVGYEEKGLFCPNNLKFSDQTVFYMLRPFKPVELSEEVGKLNVGSKYQVIVPKFSNSTCLYEVVLNQNAGTSNGTNVGESNTAGNDTSSAAGNDTSSATGDDDSEDDSDNGDSSDDDDSSNDEGADCFPGNSLVQLENGETKRMDKIEIGDRVLTGKNGYSDVFMFTHKIRQGLFDYVQINTEAGNTLRLSMGHYLYLNGRLAAASTAKYGDVVTLANGQSSLIDSVKSVKATGLFNPQTLDGDIVVDGIIASTYTTAVEPSLAHSLLCPLRLAYKYFGFATSVFNMGGKGLQNLVPGGALAY